MKRSKNESAQRQTAIEVCGSLLRVVQMRTSGTAGGLTVTTQVVPWRQEASTLLSETGQQELTTALKKIAAEHKLSGTDVRITLNGDFCVTRVATGAAEDVKHEMAELEQRSQLYLSLGPGRKALAGSVRQLDARHQHALLTVSNQRTIETLITAVSATGMKVRIIEPALFALTRILGRLNLDQTDPVMVVNLAEKGVEVGIFYQGMLLLEYRPGGRAVRENVAQIILEHLPRLSRYIGRNFRFIEGKLKSVYLSGEEGAVERMLADFAGQEKLAAAPLEMAGLASDWDFSGGVPASPFAAVLGSCLASIMSAGAENEGPNLLRNLQQESETQMGRSLGRILWPAAAAAVMVAAGFGFNLRTSWEVDRLQTEVKDTETIRSEARRLRSSLAASESKGKQLSKLTSQLAQPNWSLLWGTIGACLPPDVWMDSLKIDGNGAISISGTSYTEQGLFELVRWLKQVPQFADVALTSTRPVQHNSSAAINFQLEGRLSNFADSPEGTAHND